MCVDGSAISRTQVVVGTFHASLRGYTQRPETVSSRNCHLLTLSIMKRRPVVVAQTCAADDVCCVSFPAGGRSRAEYSFAPERRRYQQVLDVVSKQEGDLLPGRRLLKARREFLDLGPRSLWLGSSSLKQSCPALSAATWRERSAIYCRSTALFVGCPTLATAGWISTLECSPNRGQQPPSCSHSGQRGSSAHCGVAGWSRRFGRRSQTRLVRDS